jgi:hypothetical protein
MQDKYVGDIGDFGKYILLNEICKEFKLGVNWFYVKGKKEGGDKEYRYRYLKDENKNSEKYEPCCPDLYRKFRRLGIAENNNRNIAKFEEARILPTETAFYRKPLPRGEAERKEWFKESIGEFEKEKVDIIFLDPDNGIQPTPQKDKKGKDATKYVFYDEIERYYKLGKSLVIYNHRDRSPKDEYDGKIFGIKDYVKFSRSIRVLKFKRFFVRHYVFLIQNNHEKVIDKTIEHLERITKKDPKFLFEEYYPN